MASILFGSAEGIEFGPPPEKRSMRAFALAILAHLLLLGALTWGVNWKRSDPASSFEAELWSAVPQQAAPRAVEPPPPAPAAVTPPAPTPPAPRPAPEPPKVSPTTPDVDIALEQEKKRKLVQKQKDAEAKKLEERESREKAELQAKKEKEKELKAKEELAKRKAAEEAKKAEARQDAKDLEKLQQQKQAEATKKQRDDAMKRMMGMAGATGGAEASGTALKSSGPSAGYNAKVAAKVKPNVIFMDEIAGNPTAEVEVRTTPDGTIVGQRLVKSSGNKAWDDAVIKAIIRTETMPRDTDGKVPTPMILIFTPKVLL